MVHVARQAPVQAGLKQAILNAGVKNGLFPKQPWY
jgi:hypothetical protein